MIVQSLGAVEHDNNLYQVSPFRTTFAQFHLNEYQGKFALDLVKTPKFLPVFKFKTLALSIWL